MLGRNDDTSKSIAKCIVNSCKKRGFQCNYSIEYGGRAISIYSNDPETYVWIRLINLSNTSDMVMVEISNITLPERVRRNHIFTTIIQDLKNNKHVENIMISSVCTNEMYKWCKKHRFKSTGSMSVANLNFYWKDINY